MSAGADVDEREQLFHTWQRTSDEDGTVMRVGVMRRRCKRLIDELGVPAATGLRELCDVVARRVGRPIHLVPMGLDGVVSGMTATTEDAFWVFYERGTSPWHQTHIVLHEIGHLLLGHDQEPSVTEEALKVWTPSVDVATAIKRMGLAMGFARHNCYDNLAERETEVLGTLLMERVVPSAADRGLPLDGPAAQLADSLGPALRHVQRERERREESGPGGEPGV
ncbi:hypothetical protein K7472_06600 [Streptomyces sp. PTM05]|uniref:IrrE N-terminal-like domain-containing protein n=1 Tax=Streptantibioticus parmotrematis TaxID=2873249 RepID=A0ABS7QMV1_9ACTN|nr:hypothetical protein [Streptantibioticus parmotrematis]MBY8884513.1 hypothetical protein [Streptantibioticus parmotrematis]